MSPIRPTVTVVGRRLDPEHYRLRDFLTRVAQPFEWLEAGLPEAEAMLARHGATDGELPVVIDGEDVIDAATVERLAEAWGHDGAPQRSEYDLAIVGGGPAGLAAAVYAASDGLSTIVLEEDVPGGQASHTSLGAARQSNAAATRSSSSAPATPSPRPTTRPSWSPSWRSWATSAGPARLS